MRIRLSRSHETFKRERRDKALSLQTIISSTHISVPRRDPNVPRTEKETDALIVNTFRPARETFSLRTKNGTYRSLKSNPAWPSFKDMSNATRSYWIQMISASGSTPSSYFEIISGMPAGQIGQVRRYHNPGWREQTNQHIRRANSLDRI